MILTVWGESQRAKPVGSFIGTGHSALLPPVDTAWNSSSVTAIQDVLPGATSLSLLCANRGLLAGAGSAEG